MTDAPLIAVENLSRHFSAPRGASSAASVIRAVDKVSLEIGEGLSIGLVGESGCGKSTLARLLLLLERPSSGIIRYRGVAANRLTRDQLAAFRREIQPVFQDPFQSLNPKMTVGKIVSEPLRAQGNFSSAEIRRRTDEALRRAELQVSDAGRKPIDFSGGQRQRIAIARALVSGPKLIVLDEPVSSQDVSIRAQILNLLKDIQDEQRVAYLFISHDLSTVRFLCDQVHVMYMGTIVESGAPRELFAAPSHPYTDTLLNAWLPPDPRQARQRRSLPGAIRPNARPAQGCPFAPRCARALPLCNDVKPVAKTLGGLRHVACHNPITTGPSTERTVEMEND
jgi:oligopeptide/dipeptide ABC transporter ATP-binding protein